MDHNQRRPDPRVLSAELGRGGIFDGDAPTVPLAGSSGVVTADFNRDGVTDLAVITPGEELLVLLGTRAGLYHRSFRYPLGRPAHGLFATDLDGDGMIDLTVAHCDGHGLKTLFGKGDGTFSPTGATVEAHSTTGSLTAREHEVARLAAGGYTCTEIAGKLGISRRTAETHVSAIRSKLELKHKRELVYLRNIPPNRLPGSGSLPGGPSTRKTWGEVGH